MKPTKYDEAKRGSGDPKKPFKMRVIYQPRGRAFEYSALAANLYNGCEHNCSYCYAPAVVRKTRESFAKPSPRPNVLKNLEKDAQALSGDPRRVLFCFTSDPYQPIEREHRITRHALEILGENNVKANVLTKNGLLAMRDFDIMQKYGVHFGTTILFSQDDARKEFEPGAGTIDDRIKAIRQAYKLGITTWVSMEPVIYTKQVLSLLNELADYVDLFKVGKLNHDSIRESVIDWRKFLFDVLYQLNMNRSNYLIKDDLWKFATPELMTDYAQQELP